MSSIGTMQSELSQIITNPSSGFLIYQPFKAHGFLCAPPPLTLKKIRIFFHNEERLLPYAAHAVYSW
jgi:hypothetical protein